MKKLFVVLSALSLVLATNLCAETVLGPLLNDYREYVFKTAGGTYGGSGLVGINTQLHVGRSSGTRYRCFYQWSLPDNLIPDGANIRQVKIEFDFVRAAGPQTVYFTLAPIAGDLTTATQASLFAETENPSSSVTVSTVTNHFEETFTQGIPGWIVNQLSNNKFTLAVWLPTDYGYDYEHYISSSSVKLTLWVTAQSVVGDQVFENGSRITGSSIGHYEGTAFTQYGVPTSPFSFELNTTQTFRADTNLWPNSQQVLEKYRTWNSSSDVVNHKDFPVLPGLSLVESEFKAAKNAMVQVQVIDATTMGGTVDIKDPWLIDTFDVKGPKNRGATCIWHRQSSPFNISASDHWYKGVFLNENPNFDAGKPNYSVGAPNPNTIGGFESYFVKWDDSQPAQIAFQNANAGQTGVVFKQSGATATAIYKAHLGSSSASALASNSQRKIVRDSNNWYHMVYASGGSIWYSRSTNSGATWTPELQLDSLYQPSEGTFNHLPCIAYIPGTGSVNGTVMVVWVVYVEGDPSRGVSYCELNLSGQIIRREEISFGFSGTAGSDMNVGIGVGRTGNHINTPYKYYPIVVWYDPGYTSSLRARARWEGEWSLEVGLGVLTDVSQCSVAPFCYRGYLNAEWDIAYAANNTLYYAPISMGGPGAPTLGTPQQIAAGGTTRDVRTPSIYVVGGNVDPVNGEPTVTWEQTQPNSAIGFSKRTNGVWDRPAYFSHAGHAATNPVAGENYDAASGNFYIDLL